MWCTWRTALSKDTEYKIKLKKESKPMKSSKMGSTFN